MNVSSTPLPMLMVDPTYDWAWPLPRVACEPLPTTRDAAEPCRIESASGVGVTGEMVGFDADARQLRFRVQRGMDAVTLSFDKVRRVTLTRALVLARRAADAPAERLPPEAQLRTVVINFRHGGCAIGSSHGRIEHEAGYFLYAPDDDGLSLLRQFVPREAVESIEFGESAEERVADRWVRTPEQLLAAIEAQRRAPMMPLGEALADLGLVAPEVIQAAVQQAGADADLPLGERLIARGVIDRAELTTALAHKMGYPLVDVGRFPIDAQVATYMSPRAMREHRALPLMRHGKRLIVAVDDLLTIGSLTSLRGFAGTDLVPVLAPPGRLTVALAAREHDADLWAANVPTRAAPVG
ncbi:MAG: hypothetical protein OEV65_17210 [Aquincola sp.]|nr:hypothetical protein [Aquincola sp.]